MENFDIEKHILEIVKLKSNNGHKCNFENLQEFLESKRQQNSTRDLPFQESEIYPVINKLLKTDKLEAGQDAVSGEIFYQHVKIETIKVFNQMEFMEKYIYKVLQQNGDMGCSIGELKNQVLSQNPDVQVNMVNNTQLTAILKQMEKKKGLIKTVIGQQIGRKKVYMLADVEANNLVSGGPIGGTDPQGIEMINSLMDRVFEMVSRQQDVTLKDLIIFMKQIGLGQQNQGTDKLKNFKDEDFSRIIEAMMFDQRLEQTIDGHYQAVNYSYPAALRSFKSKNASNSRLVYTETPCCHCPLAAQCSATDPKAVVNPQRCLYLQQWEMEF